jgi:hypothetical protein
VQNGNRIDLTPLMRRMDYSLQLIALQMVLFVLTRGFVLLLGGK